MFIDSKLDSLFTFSAEVQDMNVQEMGTDTSEFEDSITDVMYRIEGISHFTIENFYTFDYLTSYSELYQPSEEDLITHWHTTIS